MTQVQLETLKLENQHLNDLLERIESRSPKVSFFCSVNLHLTLNVYFLIMFRAILTASALTLFEQLLVPQFVTTVVLNLLDSKASYCPVFKGPMISAIIMNILLVFKQLVSLTDLTVSIH